MSRRMILASGAAIAALIALHPPWTARAIVMRMTFDVPGAPPATVLDTVSWGIPSAAIYARPSLAIPARQQTAFQARVSKGDTSTAREWQERIEDIERRYSVPEQLRSEWIRDTTGSAPTVAFTRKIVTAHFEVDAVRLGVFLLAVFLLAVVAATTAAAILKSRRSSNSPA